MALLSFSTSFGGIAQEVVLDAEGEPIPASAKSFQEGDDFDTYDQPPSEIATAPDAVPADVQARQDALEQPAGPRLPDHVPDLDTMLLEGPVVETSDLVPDLRHELMPPELAPLPEDLPSGVEAIKPVMDQLPLPGLGSGTNLLGPDLGDLRPERADAPGTGPDVTSGAAASHVTLPATTPAAAPRVLPLVLPELTYGVCARIDVADNHTCTTGLAVGVPTPLDLNGDERPDALVVVAPCGLTCVDVTFQTTGLPAGLTYTGPADVFLVYDTNDDPATESLVIGGFDTLAGNVSIPKSLHISAVVSGTSSAPTVDLHADSVGVMAPIALYYESRVGEADGPIETWKQVYATARENLPDTLDLSISSDSDGGTSLEYLASRSMGGVDVLYGTHVAASDDLTYLEINASRVPMNWDFDMQSGDGALELGWNAGSTIGQVDVFRAEVQGGDLVRVHEATLTDVATTVEVLIDPCQVSFAASSAMGITAQQGRDSFLVVTAPHHVHYLNNADYDNFALSVPGVSAFDYTAPCFNSQEYSTIVYELVEALDTFDVLVLTDDVLVSVDVEPANGRGVPTAANLVLGEQDSLVLSDTSDAFGRIEFCYTRSQTCWTAPTTNDHVLIYEQASDAEDAITGRITGLKTADLTIDEGLQADATFAPGGQPFEVFFLLDNDSGYILVSNMPQTLTFSTDMETEATLTNDDPIGNIYAVGYVGGNTVYLELDQLPSDSTVTASYDGDSGEFDATEHVGQVRGCFSSTGVCPFYSGDFVFIASDAHFTANFHDLKHADAAFTADSLTATLETLGGSTVYGRYESGGSLQIEGLIVGIPAVADLSFDGSSAEKEMTWEGNGARTNRIIISGNSFFVDAADVPTTVTARWDLDSADRTVTGDLSGTLGSLFGCGSTAGRSVSALGEGVESFEATWAEDLSSLRAETTAGGTIDKLRVYLSGATVCGVAMTASFDYAVYDSAAGIFAGQATGMELIDFAYETDTATGELMIQQGRTVIASWNLGAGWTTGQITGIPAHVTVTFDGSGTAKSLAWNGHGQTTGHVVFSGPSFYVYTSGLPSTATVTWDLSSSARQLGLDASGTVNQIIGWAKIGGSSAWKSATLAAEGVRDFTATWSTNMREFTVTVHDGQKVDRLRLYVSGGTAMGIPDISSYDYGSYNENADAILAHLTGPRLVDVGFSSTLLDAEVDMDTGRTLVLHYLKGTEFAYGQIIGTPSSMELVSDLSTYGRWDASSTVSSLLAYGTFGSTVFYVDATSVPTKTHITFDLGNRQIDVDLNSPSTKIGSATLLLSRSAAPFLSFVQGSGIPEMIIDWSSNYEVIDVDPGTTTGRITFGLDFSGTGIGTFPADTGVHFVDTGSWDYISGRVDGLRDAHLDMASSTKTLDVDTTGGRFFEGFYVPNGNDYAYFYANMKNGNMHMESNLNDAGEITQPSSTNYGVIGLFSGYTFAFLLSGADDFTVNVYQSGKRIVANPNTHVTRLDFVLQKTSGSGIVGTGFKYVDGYVRGMGAGSKTITFGDASGSYGLDLGSQVSEMKIHASTNGKRWGTSGDHFIWDIYGGSSINVRVSNFQSAEYTKSGSRHMFEIDTGGGRSLTGYLLSGSQFLQASITNLPSFAELDVVVSSTGYVDWDASSYKSATLTVYSNWFGGSSDYINGRWSPIPSRIDLDWQFSLSGEVDIDMSSRSTATVCGRSGSHSICGTMSIYRGRLYWDVDSWRSGYVLIDSDNYRVEGNMAYLYGSSWGSAVGGRFWANNAGLRWTYGVPYLSGSMFLDGYFCARVSGTWLCI